MGTGMGSLWGWGLPPALPSPPYLSLFTLFPPQLPSLSLSIPCWDSQSRPALLLTPHPVDTLHTRTFFCGRCGAEFISFIAIPSPLLLPPIVLQIPLQAGLGWPPAAWRSSSPTARGTSPCVPPGNAVMGGWGWVLVAGVVCLGGGMELLRCGWDFPYESC